MKLYLSIIYFSFLSIPFFAQDTIFTSSKTSLLVKVLEISKTEVSYKNFYNPDGVIYKINNSEVEKIIYENGKTESRFQLKEKTSVDKSIIANANVFTVEGKRLLYKNNDITHKQAYKLIMQRDPQQNTEDLNEALMNAESKRNGQIIFTLLGPTFGLGSLYVGRRNYYGPHDLPKLKAFLISGVALCITSETIAIIYHSIKNKHIRKAALLYNTEIY